MVVSAVRRGSGSRRESCPRPPDVLPLSWAPAVEPVPGTYDGVGVTKSETPSTKSHPFVAFASATSMRKSARNVSCALAVAAAAAAVATP